MAELQWNASTDQTNNASKKIDESSNIVRLVQDPEIKKKLSFDEISIPNVDEGTTDVQGGDKAQETAGITYPIIRINDFVFAKENITSMTLASVDLLPTISLSLSFLDSAFISKSMPKDGDLLSLYMRTNTAALQYMRSEFLITSCKVTSYNAGETRININGKMFIPGFSSMNNTMGVIGTSKDAMKEIAKKYEIGFSFNDYDDTDDLQSWIACHESMEMFINDILPHVWKDETSFFRTWIDFYYNLCFVNVNKFLLSADNNEEIDITFLSKTSRMEKAVDHDNSVDAAAPTIKLITNAEDMRGTPFFVSEWHPVNNSMNVSLSNGYSSVSYHFAHNQNVINNDVEESFRELTNVPAYDRTKTDTHILLRGRAKYEKGKNPDNEQARVNYDFVNTYIQRDWRGIEYMIDPEEKNKDSNTGWSGNVHSNYTRAVQHNKININELSKMYIQVTCEGFCTQVMRGERVPVYLVYSNVVDEANVNSTGNDRERGHNKFYSGYYIVDSVTYKYKPESNDVSPIKTVFTLCRREWPTPEEIEK